MTQKTLVVLTGASRGFGKCIKEAFLESFDDLELILISKSPVAHEHSFQLDLSNLAQVESFFTDTLLPKLQNISKDTKTILIHNAGTLGPLGNLCDQNVPMTTFQQCFDLNVTSCCWLSAQWERHCSQPIIVNVSSLAAVQSLPGMAVYCSHKAARDAFHAGLQCRTLNYAPGPLEGTDMSKELQQAALGPPEYVDPMDSARKLVQLLEEDQFISGSHVDYYDLK